MIAQSVKSDLLQAGLVPNIDKSVWEPVQLIDWLGMSWDSNMGILRVIKRRVDDTIQCIDDIVSKLPRITARRLARFVGIGIYRCQQHWLRILGELCRDRVFQNTLTRVLQASRAENTIKKYKNSLAAWEVWCRLNRVSPTSPSNLELSRYFIGMFNSDAPYSRMEAAFYAIKWKIDCLPNMVSQNPCDSKFIHLLLEGLKRILAKPVSNRKEPITPDILHALVVKFGSGDLKCTRLCSMFLLAFAAFLRYEELANLKVCDLDMCYSHIKVFIEKSKTDQLREGAWVVVGATGKSTCPVSMLQKYLVCAGINDPNSEEFLFRPVVLLKSLNKYVLRSGKLSYTRCSEILKEALEAIGLDSSKFGLHSLCAGGATAAAEIGVPDRLCKRHGRWKSDSSKDRYVKESLSNKLVVSMNLGI
ncbi:integrase/recombinase xerD homolog [Amphiura filiformis]|uniref:integrase/recombinase xerD homolog n=1 Tax=Amphiura filiformis TaxID=82378 RepID=UPI003B21ABE0